MKTSPAGRAFVGLHEGLRTTAYRDAIGVWTIGYGHTAMAGEPKPEAGMTVTAVQADAILGRDLERFEASVEKLLRVPVTQNEFDALVSFAFNLGAGNLGASTLLRKLNAGDKVGAAAEFGKWNKAGGRVLAGLTRRRAEERSMFANGVYPGVSAGIPRVPENSDVPAPEPEPLIEPSAQTIARLNLRISPPAGEIVLTLPDGHPIEVVDTWHKVKTVVDGQLAEGWVSARFAEPI